MNKKAQDPSSLFWLIAFLLLLSIGGVIATNVFGNFFNAALQNPVLNATAEQRASFQAGADIGGKWDYLIFFVFIGLSLGIIILGYFIQTNSVFFPFFIILLLIGVLLSVIFTYVWEQLKESDTLSTTIDDYFPLTDNLMENLAIYFSVVGVLAFIATYAKGETG